MSAAHSRRAWGWHPLAPDWAARVVAGSGVRPGDLVLDVGAGTGALTTHLVRAGARVIAIELHAGRAALLRERFAGAPVTVVQTDAAGMYLPGRPFRVVSNPPYHLTADLLALLLGPRSRLVAADLVLQRAVVRRYCAGRAPAASHAPRRFELCAGMPVPRRAFHPPPQVDSAVLRIRVRR